MAMPGRKTLFLGFEGVLHHRNATVFEFLAKMPLLEQTLGASEVDIVALSKWDFEHDFDRLVAAFPAGLRSRVVGRTSEERNALHGRFREIQNWRRSHPVSDWRALDSETHGYPEDCPELIRCSPAVGLSGPQAEALKAWLEGRK